MRIEIDLSTLVFVGVCGDAALFVDADDDEILLRVGGGNKHDLAAAAKEFLKAVAALEGP
jgi:hypothetical protein